MPQFNFSTFTSQIFWLCLIFAMQYLVSVKVIIPGFRKIFLNRKKYIDEQLNLAQKLTDNSIKLKNEYDQQLDQAKTEALTKMDETIKEIKKKNEEQIKQIDLKLANDFKNYEEQLQKMKVSIQGDVDNMVLSTAKLIIDKVIDTDINKEEIAKYIN